jgi:PAS domain-containing protein
MTMPTKNGNQRGVVAPLIGKPLPRPVQHRPESSRRGKPAEHKELEVILMRQLADCLAMPIFIVNKKGTLLFYNEPAEVLLGQRFEETGELTADQWAGAFMPTDLRNRPLPPEKVPLVIALRERRPVHASLRIRGLDQVVRDIQATAFPLVGRANRFLGAVAIFWEVARR